MPKADIRRLWEALGIESPGTTGRHEGPEPLFEPDLVWQRFNPYPKLQVQRHSGRVGVRAVRKPGNRGLISPDSASRPAWTKSSCRIPA